MFCTQTTPCALRPCELKARNNGKDLFFLFMLWPHVHDSVSTQHIGKHKPADLWIQTQRWLRIQLQLLWKQKMKNSSACAHTNTDVWCSFVHHISFIAAQCNDSAFLILCPSVCEIASSFFLIPLKCALFLVYVARAFDRWIPPRGAIKCIVSFHLISSHHLSYGLVQGNINNVRCRWVCLQVANI